MCLSEGDSAHKARTAAPRVVNRSHYGSGIPMILTGVHFWFPPAVYEDVHVTESIAFHDMHFRELTVRKIQRQSAMQLREKRRS